MTADFTVDPSVVSFDPSFVPLTGRCKCGQVQFRIDDAPIITHCCHCRTCQQTSGSAFCINTMIETDRVTILAGKPEPYQGAGSHKAVQCPACQSTLWTHIADLGEAIALVGVGMLEQGERLPPEAHYFTRSRHPWVILPPGVPAFEQHGDPGKASAGERIMAALARAGVQPPPGAPGERKPA
jgi:hypothetical protein